MSHTDCLWFGDGRVRPVITQTWTNRQGASRHPDVFRRTITSPDLVSQGVSRVPVATSAGTSAHHMQCHRAREKLSDATFSAKMLSCASPRNIMLNVVASYRGNRLPLRTHCGKTKTIAESSNRFRRPDFRVWIILGELSAFSFGFLGRRDQMGPDDATTLKCHQYVEKRTDTGSEPRRSLHTIQVPYPAQSQLAATKEMAAIATQKCRTSKTKRIGIMHFKVSLPG